MIRISYLIFTFLFALYSTDFIKAQEADSLFKTGNYTLAALEYERIIAFSSDKPAINNSRYMQALCYKYLKKYDKARESLLKISLWDVEESIKMTYEYETILCCYLSGNFYEALTHIDQSGIENNLTYRSNSILLKALSYNESGQWEKAYEASCIYVKENYDKPEADKLITLLTKNYAPKNLPHVKKESVANILKFVPGLVQMYTGDISEGIFSFSLNLAFLSFGTYQIFEHYYFTGYFVGAIGLSKVYFGGQTRALFLLNRKNYINHRKFCDTIKTIINK